MSDAPSLQLFHGADLTGASVTRDASSYDSDMGAPLTISFSGTDFMNTVAGGRFITSYTVTETGGSASATQQPVDGTSNTLVDTRASIDSPLGFGGDIILHNKTGYGGGPVGPGDYSLGFSGNTVLQTKISHGGISAGPSDYSLTIQDTSNANGSSADLTTTGDIAAGPKLESWCSLARAWWCSAEFFAGGWRLSQGSFWPTVSTSPGGTGTCSQVE